jgi:hypothetical protein
LELFAIPPRKNSSKLSSSSTSHSAVKVVGLTPSRH